MTLASAFRDVAGRLNDGGKREIARLLRDGRRPAEIARIIGGSEAAIGRHCVRIGSVLGIPTAKERYLAFCQDVCRRAEAGATDADIAAALGRSVGAIQAAREKLGHIKYRVLRFTPAEIADIDRRIVAGDRTAAICQAVGCTPSTVARRKTLLEGRINPEGALCDCGKQRGHRGMCQLPLEKQALIRQRLTEGAFVETIARELGMTAPNIRNKYARPILAELRAAGLKCRCGQPIGHTSPCVAKAEACRNSFDSDQVAQARTLAIAGTSIAKLSAAMGLPLYTARQLLAQVRAALKAEGVRCACGKPIDHRRGCDARHSKGGAKPKTITFGAAGRSMADATRRKVVRLIRTGWSVKVVCDRTGESEWRVTQVMSDVIAAGVPLPVACPGCGKTRNHRGPCPLPTKCTCGRDRNHRGPCRTEKKPRLPELSKQQKAWLWQRYHDGMSIRRMSEGSGVAFSTVQRVVAYWTARRRKPLPPCACGRPLRHPGGCVKNTPGALDRRWVEKIEQRVLAGSLPMQIAREMELSLVTVVKHSTAVRDRQLAAGVTCACGRPIGHAYWCTAKWDAYDQPRGRKPFAPLVEKQAIVALLRGDVVADIAEAAGVGTGSIWRLRRTLSEEQRAQRTRAVRDRIARNHRASSADIMDRIKTAVSKRIDPAVRDDVIGELYLAVIEGRVEVEQIAAAVRSFVNRGLTDWQSAYGPRSLDETLSKDGKRTLAEVFGDTTAALAIDEITIGEPPV